MTLDGTALDNWITGHYGEDRAGLECEDACADLDEDGECPFDGDTAACTESRAADAADRANDLAQDR